MDGKILIYWTKGPKDPDDDDEKERKIIELNIFSVSASEQGPSKTPKLREQSAIAQERAAASSVIQFHFSPFFWNIFSGPNHKDVND